MKKLISLKYKAGKDSYIIDFGIPENEVELKRMYALRYKVYEKKGYIDPKRYSEKLDIDENDSLEFKHLYIVASCDGEYVGTLRSIKKTPLPTEEDFDFVTPEALHGIQHDNLREIGRLISISHPKTNLLPRGFIMLFMLYAVAQIFKKENIYGGYAFIKNSLMKKMSGRKIPFHIITKYTEKYPKNGVLYPYFHQPNDLVIPVYYLTDEFFDYANKKTHNPLFFRWSSEIEVELKYNIFTRIISYFL